MNPVSSLRVILSKHHRGDIGSRDYNKNFATATYAPDKKFRFKLCPIDTLMDHTSTTELASFTANHRLSVTNAINWCTSYDMETPILIPDRFSLSTGTFSGPYTNLFSNHEKFDYDVVLEWQEFVNTHFDPVDQVSSVWLSAWFLKALSDDLHDEVFQEHSELPPHQQGAASLIKLALDKIQNNSHEAKRALQSIITSFSLAAIPHEDVKVAVTHLKAVISALDNTHDLPTKSLTYILDGMATSSSPEFNTLCTMLKLQYSCISHLEKEDKFTLFPILNDLNSHYRDAVQARTWPKLPTSSKSQSAFLASKPSNSVPVDSTSSSSTSHQDPFALLASNPDLLRAFVSSFNPAKPRDLNNTICYNCDEKGHIASNCPLPRCNHPRGRPRDRSNSRDRRSPSSRSRDRPFCNRSATPAPSRHRSSSRDHKQPSTEPKQHVTFEKKVYNVSVQDDDRSLDSQYNDSALSAFLL
jgi:hypothetical protein